MSALAEKSIYLVSDDLERSRRIIDFLGWRFPVSPVGLHAEDAVEEHGPGLCVFDADLSNRDNIPRIKQINQSFESCEKYFVVDENKRGNLIQANSLGAHGVLRKSKLQSDAARILQAYRSELMQNIWRDMAEGTRKTLTGISTLNDDIYDAVARNSALPKTQVMESCDQIISSLREEALSIWLDAVRQHHSYTYRHCMIVSALATSFATSLGMRRSDVERLTVAALLHDVGKMKLPLGLLDKPGALTPEERELINKHPGYGADILKADGQFSEEVIEITLHHHEFLDGSGYPDGLPGDQISDPVRIMTVVDIFSALIDERAYKAAMPNDEAYETLVGMGRKLDQDIVRAFEPTAASAIPASEKGLSDVVAI